MHPATLERALHKWPLWRETILEARAKLNFKPALLEVREEVRRWEQASGWDRAVELSLEALRKMGLPWYFGFYWLACFCVDYQRAESLDLRQIKVPPENACKAWGQHVREKFVKDRGIILLCHKSGPEAKLYPPYPFLLETSFLFALERGETPPKSEVYGVAELDWGGRKVKVDGLFSVADDGRIMGRRMAASIRAPAGTYVQILFGKKRKIPPEFTVEFPMFLATEDTVSVAFEQIQAYREGFKHYISHPLQQYLGEAKVRAGDDIVEQRREPTMDIDRYCAGELIFEELISREWKREFEREGRVASKLRRGQISRSEAQTAIYHRVRRRLVCRALIPPRPQKGWRSTLMV